MEELPYMVVNVGIAAPFARKGVTAFQDDFAGGADAGRIYGTLQPQRPRVGYAS